jgi:hypothetical protein
MPGQHAPAGLRDHLHGRYRFVCRPQKPVAPALKAAGARTVVLAGNPAANEMKYRSAGVNRFIFVKCNVPDILRGLLKEEGML